MSDTRKYAPKLRGQLTETKPELLPVLDLLDRDDKWRNELLGDVLTKSLPLYPALKQHYAALKQKCDQFKHNAAALQDPHSDAALVDGPSPLTISKQDVIDFYTIGQLSEVLRTEHWLYAPEVRYELFETAQLPKHIADVYERFGAEYSSELSKTLPQKAFGSWVSAISQPAQSEGMAV